MNRRLFIWILLVAVVLFSTFTSAQSQQRSFLAQVIVHESNDREMASVASTEPLELSDHPEALDPENPRSEATQDHLQALALYGMGRLQEHREQFPEALRYFQRAVRYDPAARPVLQNLVVLAVSLNRVSEAARYLLLATSLDESDAPLLRRVAVHVTETRDLETARLLYEKAITLAGTNEPTAEDVILWFQCGKLSLATDELAQAWKHFARVWEAIEAPDEHGIDEEVRQLMLTDAANMFPLFLSSEVAESEAEEALGYRFFAELALQAQDDIARSIFERVWQQSLKSPSRRFDEARLLAMEGKTDAALARLGEYLEEDHRAWQQEPYEFLAALLDKQDADEALLIEKLEALHAKQPDNVFLAYSLANRYRRAGNFEQALSLLSELIDQSPSLTGYIDLIDAYRQQQEWPKLLETLATMFASVRSLSVLGELGDRLIDDNSAVSAILQLVEQRVEEDEELQAADLDVAIELAVLSDQIEVATRLHERRREIAEPEEVGRIAMEFALSLMMHEKYPHSASVLEEAIGANLFDENDPDPYFHLAAVLEMSGETQAAVDAAKRTRELAEARADELGPRFYRYIARLPWIYYHARQYEAAAEGYRALIDQYENNFDDEAAREAVRDAKMAMSNIAALQSKFLAAENWLEQVLDEYPQEVGALNDLGYLWADRGVHLERSLRMIQQAVHAEPDNEAYRDSLGWVLYRLGRFEEAAAELERAAAVDEPDGVILDHLGDVQSALDRVSEASDAWNRAIAAFEREENFEQVEAVRKKLVQLEMNSESP